MMSFLCEVMKIYLMINPSFNCHCSNSWDFVRTRTSGLPPQPNNSIFARFWYRGKPPPDLPDAGSHDQAPLKTNYQFHRLPDSFIA